MNPVRRGIAFLIALISVAVWTQVPDVGAPDLGVGLDRAPSSTAACPVVTGRDARSEALVGTRLPGEVHFLASSGGVVLTDSESEAGEFGGLTFDVGSAAGASTVALVVDLPEEGSAASLVTSSDVVLAAAMCTPPVNGETAIAGLSTASGERLDLVLANPYANDAVVEVRTVSEAGADSASELESVVVPARSAVTVDLAQLLPLRSRLSIRIIPERGVVHAAGVQSSPNERMVVEAVHPSSEWLLPVPDTGVLPTITVLPTTGVDTGYTVDAFTEAGAFEGVGGGIVPSDGHVVIDTESLPEGTAAVRVTTDGASVASVVIEGDTIRAGTPGAPFSASTWVVPGPSGPGAVLRLTNPTGLDATVEVRPLLGGSDIQTVSVPAGTSTVVRVEGPGPGHIVQSDGDVFVAWSSSSDAGFALAVGMPQQTAGE
jgi:hypothetical protein